MIQPVKLIIYVLMIAIGLLAMYSILNAGNPNSLLRAYVPDPKNDVYVAMISSISVFVLGFIVFYSRDSEGFQQIVKMNEKKIKTLRKQGKTDEEIAVLILAAMGSVAGYRHKMARRKLVAYLAEFS